MQRPSLQKLSVPRPSKNLPYIQELAALRQRSIQPTPSEHPEYASETMEVSPSPMTEEDPGLSRVLKSGNLIKTSKSRATGKAAHGVSRQRKFRLTRDSLEYLQNFSHVSL